MLDAGVITTKVAALVALLSFETHSKRASVLAEILQIKASTLSMAADNMVKNMQLTRCQPFRDPGQTLLTLAPEGVITAREYLRLLRAFSGSGVAGVPGLQGLQA